MEILGFTAGFGVQGLGSELPGAGDQDSPGNLPHYTPHACQLSLRVPRFESRLAQNDLGSARHPRNTSEIYYDKIPIYPIFYPLDGDYKYVRLKEAHVGIESGSRLVQLQNGSHCTSRCLGLRG